MENKGKENCVCTSATCARRGDCEACKAYHRDKGGLTSCERKEQKKQ